MSASKSARASMGFLNLWTTDKGTFPIVLIASAAAIGAATSAGRFLLNHPDVCLSKTKRENTMHYSDEVGADWRERRFRLANLKRNPINQSRQFDLMYEKEANKVVQR
ncbi:Phosphatidylinositol 3, partial [Globisporangium splendens]